jgi:FtsZ-binding cell division protein ZapB
LLEERIQLAVERIASLKAENKRLAAVASQLEDGQHALERRFEALAEEKRGLQEESRTLRTKQEEWVRFERDREEIRTRIDGMLAKFEELEI